ncbi:MAG: hypothetical protein ACJ748_15810 [Flavisolibacter sp.]
MLRDERGERDKRGVCFFLFPFNFFSIYCVLLLRDERGERDKRVEKGDEIWHIW